jgi:hypothetical protein
VIKRIADDNRGTKVDAAFMLGFARTIAMLCGGVDGAGGLETSSIEASMKSAIFTLAKPLSRASGSSLLVG